MEYKVKTFYFSVFFHQLRLCIILPNFNSNSTFALDSQSNRQSIKHTHNFTQNCMNFIKNISK